MATQTRSVISLMTWSKVNVARNKQEALSAGLRLRFIIILLLLTISK